MKSIIIRAAKRKSCCLWAKRRFGHNIQIPEPTWSVKDLDLTSQKPPLPQSKLDRLSRLALIQVEDKDDLRQDLSNMIHMIDQVSSFAAKGLGDKGENDDDDDDKFSASQAAQLYDVPRGVTSTPLRTMENDSFQDSDQEISDQVWKTLLQPKTTRKGGRHDYFSIQTQNIQDQEREK